MSTFDKPTNTNEPNKQSEFLGFNEIIQQFSEGKLPLNEIQEITKGLVTVNSHSNTWISSTKRLEGGKFEIKIGEQLLPSLTSDKWNWGARSVEVQFLVKVAHEYAHVIQNKFDKVLLDWLDGKINEVPKFAESYIRLYALLNETGILTGLADENIYHNQSQTTGNLKMSTYEDMAELIGASILSKDYFMFRMENSNIQLSKETIDNFYRLIMETVEQFKIN
jgi:hypothetical protein